MIASQEACAEYLANNSALHDDFYHYTVPNKKAIVIRALEIWKTNKPVFINEKVEFDGSGWGKESSTTMEKTIDAFLTEKILTDNFHLFGGGLGTVLPKPPPPKSDDKAWRFDIQSKPKGFINLQLQKGKYTYAGILLEETLLDSALEFHGKIAKVMKEALMMSFRAKKGLCVEYEKVPSWQVMANARALADGGYI